MTFHILNNRSNGDGTFTLMVQSTGNPTQAFTVTSRADLLRQLLIYRGRMADQADLDSLVGTDITLSNA